MRARHGLRVMKPKPLKISLRGLFTKVSLMNAKEVKM